MSNEERRKQMMTEARAYTSEIYDDEPADFKTEEKIAETIADFCAGWRAADKSRWIPVDRELPKEGGEYLVSDGTDSMVDIWLCGIGWRDPDNNERVTHWMSKPTPPAPRKED